MNDDSSWYNYVLFNNRLYNEAVGIYSVLLKDTLLFLKITDVHQDQLTNS